MSEKRKLLEKNFQEILETVKVVTDNFERTYNDSKQIDLNSINALSELEWDGFKDIEVLTARFARLSDIYIQKFLRLLDELEAERQGSIIDRINRAEKRGLIESSEMFLEIRDLRNDIAHDYLPDELLTIFKDVFQQSPKLIKACRKALSVYGYES